MDVGTESEPIEIECPICNGYGCDKCKNGNITIDGCPNDYCREVVSAVRLIELFDKGLPPVAGGTLDQSVWFIEAAGLFKREESVIEAERYNV